MAGPPRGTSAQARFVDWCAILHATSPSAQATSRVLALIADTYAIARYARAGGIGATAIDGASAGAGRSGAGPVPVWGGGSGSAADAAFLNGCAAEALDFQEVLIDGRNNGHAAVVIVPALLALAAENNVQPGDVLAGLRTAFIANIALARALGRGHRRGTVGFRTTSLVAPIAAALGGAFMVGASAQRAGHAVALAATMLPAGLLAAMAPQSSDFTPDKDLAVGLSARHAVECVMLALAGTTGPADALAGPRGWLASFGFDDARPDVLAEAIDEDLLDRYAFKLYPANFGCQCAIRLALDAVARKDLAPIATADVRVKTSSAQSLSSRTLSSHVGARFSLPYAVASAIVRGRSVLADFEGDALRAGNVLAFMDRIRLMGDDALEERHLAEGIFPASLKVIRTDGTMTEAGIDTPQDGMSEDQFRTAFLAKIASLCPAGEAADIAAGLAANDINHLLGLVAGRSRPNRENA